MITLKSVKIYNKLSDDSTAFSATICWQGKKVGECSDNGQCGNIEYKVPSSILEEMHKYAATLPDTECEGHKLKMNLDLVIDRLLREDVKAKEDKKTQKWIEKNKASFASQGHETVILYLNNSVAVLPFKPSVKTAEETVFEWTQKNPKENLKEWKVA